MKVITMTVTQDAIRNKFLVQVQRNALMTMEEADALADFFVGVGDHMLSELTPLLNGYRERIAHKIRNEVIDEVISEISAQNLWTRGGLVAKLKFLKVKLNA